MYVEKLTMKDFRCFEQAEVSFVYPDKDVPKEALPNVTLLIGINGTGKTSVLKAVAMAQLTYILPSTGLYLRHLVRIGTTRPRETATVAIQFHSEQPHRLPSKTDNKPQFASDPGAEIRILRVGDSELYDYCFWSANGFTFSGTGGITGRPGLNGQFFDEDLYSESSPTHFALGYGAFRRCDPPESADPELFRNRHLRYQRIAGLFGNSIHLYPLGAWTPKLESKSRQKEVRDLLNSLLPEGTEFTGEFKDADAIFKHNGVKLPFGALSDGFRSYIGLVADMLYHLNYVCPKKSKLDSLSGVVMIDDIDVHLHPKWQRQVVPDLSRTFPKLQFIITSHSPLVAGTLHAANIRVIEDNQIHEYTERIHGLSADQILTSSYFMLDTSRSPAAVEKLNRIADRVADDGDPSAAIEFLNELAGKSNGHPAKKAKKPGRKK